MFAHDLSQDDNDATHVKQQFFTLIRSQSRCGNMGVYKCTNREECDIVMPFLRPAAFAFHRYDI